MEEHGFEKFLFMLLEEYQCSSKKELNKRLEEIKQERK